MLGFLPAAAGFGDCALAGPGMAKTHARANPSANAINFVFMILWSGPLSPVPWFASFGVFSPRPPDVLTARTGKDFSSLSIWAGFAYGTLVLCSCFRLLPHRVIPKRTVSI